MTELSSTRVFGERARPLPKESSDYNFYKFGFARHREDARTLLMPGGCFVAIPFRVHGPGLLVGCVAGHDQMVGSVVTRLHPSRPKHLLPTHKSILPYKYIAYRPPSTLPPIVPL
jgi:hypothetical protein